MRISAAGRSRIVLSQSCLCSNPNASQHVASKACVLVPIIVRVPSSSGLSRFVQPIVYKFPPPVCEAFAREASMAPSSPWDQALPGNSYKFLSQSSPSRAGTADVRVDSSCPVTMGNKKFVLPSSSSWHGT